MAETAGVRAPEAPWAPLVDLSDAPLDRVTTGEDAVGHALDRVLRSLHDRDGVISSFGSFISQS